MAAAQATVPGLERLTQLATININQTSSGYNGSNYTVFSEDDALFNVNEIVPDTFFRQSGSHRPFVMEGVENTGRKVFSFHRTLAWMSEKVEMFMDGALVSVVEMKSTFMTPIFHINDAVGNLTLRLKGRVTTSFQLQTNTNTPIGSIVKKYRGWKTEWFSFKDDYTITFPADLSVQFKLAVIVACIYMDFRFHEGK